MAILLPAEEAVQNLLGWGLPSCLHCIGGLLCGNDTVTYLLWPSWQLMTILHLHLLLFWHKVLWHPVCTHFFHLHVLTDYCINCCMAQSVHCCPWQSHPMMFIHQYVQWSQQWNYGHCCHLLHKSPTKPSCMNGIAEAPSFQVLYSVTNNPDHF
jgi:hypothetical protein